MRYLERHPTFDEWFEDLWRRHTGDLTFQEIRKAVQALSHTYVQMRRQRLDSALRTAGKRAAFSLFYGPLHFLLLSAICRELNVTGLQVESVMDLGCGTGVSGAAWATEAEAHPSLIGIDHSPWAVEEAAWMYRRLHLEGRTRRVDLERVVLPGPGAGIMVAFTVNEMGPKNRERLKLRLLEAASRGATVLVVEPISRRVTPWWNDWADHFLQAGGRSDEWRFSINLPQRLKLMDKASGLDHRELTGRSLWLHRAGNGVPPRIA
jgi:hypothetical protein